MLTKDENIVLSTSTCSTRSPIRASSSSAERDPDETVKQAAESAVREVIGASDDGSARSAGRAPRPEALGTAQCRAEPPAGKKLQTTLRHRPAASPSSISRTCARRRKSRKRSTTPSARARTSSSIEQRSRRLRQQGDAGGARRRGAHPRRAAGYKAERIAKAEGDAQRFNLIAPQYKAAPEVTRKRLYLETMRAGARREPQGDRSLRRQETSSTCRLEGAAATEPAPATVRRDRCRRRRARRTAPRPTREAADAYRHCRHRRRLIVLLASIGRAFVVNEGAERAWCCSSAASCSTGFKPGLHFKLPPLQQVLRFDRRILSLDSAPERYLTSEKKDVSVDFYVKWRIADRDLLPRHRRRREHGRSSG